MKVIIVNSNPIYKKLELTCKHLLSCIVINEKMHFNFDNISAINPDYIFFPHWSYLISDQIFEKFNCIVFHMTDLPYGRGGSPLQNLIVKGHTETKISALKVVRELDAGDIYLKEDLDLSGTATEIFERASNIMIKMILNIIETNPTPQPQMGEVTIFKRRKPNESDISKLSETEKVYDYIRMLDCEGYPNAYIETEHFKFEFINADYSQDNLINAHVRITKK